MISVMSYDRIGIIADVTGAIKNLGGNMEDISQTVMRGYFTMMLLASFPDDVTEDALRSALHAVKGLSDFEIGVLEYRKENGAPPPGDNDLYIVTASGPDRTGLVAGITEFLRLRGINIIDLSTRSDGGIYTMMFLVRLPEMTDVARLKKSMQIAMEEYGLAVELRHQAIFSKTNEI